MNKMNTKINISDLYALPNRQNHYCFGCSPANQHGLQMKFHASEEHVYSLLKIPDHLCGWSNLVHGGVISTIIDEIMSWTAIYFTGKFILTKSMNLEFQKPLYIGEELTARGTVVEVTSERAGIMKGEVFNEKGELAVVSSGHFALFTPEAILKMGIMDKETVDEFVSFMHIHQEAT